MIGSKIGTNKHFVNFEFLFKVHVATPSRSRVICKSIKLHTRKFENGQVKHATLVAVVPINDMYSRAWYGMEDDFSIFHAGNFLPFHFHSIPKIFHFIFHSILKFSSIFHSILKFSSIFHSILPYQRNFRLEAMQRIYCCFAPLQCCKEPLVKVRQQY